MSNNNPENEYENRLHNHAVETVKRIYDGQVIDEVVDVFKQALRQWDLKQGV